MTEMVDVEYRCLKSGRIKTRKEPKKIPLAIEIMTKEEWAEISRLVALNQPTSGSFPQKKSSHSGRINK